MAGVVGFWEDKTLAELDDDEWEQLCDGCARCCMIKLENEADGKVHYTALTCRLLDLDTCRCTRYPDRHRLVADCVELNPETAATFDWLPDTCAYRRLALGLPLLWWHPLVSGDSASVHEAGISVRGKTLPADAVHEEDQASYVVRWIHTLPSQKDVSRHN